MTDGNHMHTPPGKFRAIPNAREYQLIFVMTEHLKASGQMIASPTLME
jgi:hypothetical protein